MSEAITTRIPFSERCRREGTRDVIFLLRYRTGKTREYPHVEGVWLTREEAEEFAKGHAYRYPGGWQVYGVCADGELAQLLRTT